MKLSAVKTDGYAFELEKPFGTYSFIALDACPQEIGPSKPLNFFGFLDQKDMNFFASALNNSLERHHNHTFGMTHYPTSTLLFGRTREGLDFWEMSHHVTLWFSGHLHTLAGGIGDKMYAYQHGSLLELELGDMKSHGIFRIVVVDHDLVSFKDLKLYTPYKLPMSNISSGLNERPPIVIITNPKDSRYTLPDREPIHLIENSTHIRCLIWSANPVVDIKLIIDGVSIASIWTYNGRGKSWSSIENLNEQDAYIPLWITDWNPRKYSDKRAHTMTVDVTDKQGLRGNHTVIFRTDGQIEKMNAGIGGFIISLNFGYIFKELFIVGYIIITVGLLLIPKAFVMITRQYGNYQLWKERVSRELILRDRVSSLYLEEKNGIGFQAWCKWVYSDFIFTMKAYFFRHCELVNDARVGNNFLLIF